MTPRPLESIAMQTSTKPRHGIGAADWSARLIGSDFIEVRRGNDSCLVNVAFEPQWRVRVVYASEAESAWFPQLAERLQGLLPALPGRFVLV